MANGSTRGILIATNTDIESSVAYYNEESGTDDTNANKGIFYKYPIDGTIHEKSECRERSSNTWSCYHVPSAGETSTSSWDTVAPTVENITGKTEITKQKM